MGRNEGTDVNASKSRYSFPPLRRKEGARVGCPDFRITYSDSPTTAYLRVIPSGSKNSYA
jgi:hypothetical protein